MWTAGLTTLWGNYVSIHVSVKFEMFSSKLSDSFKNVFQFEE